MMTNTERIINFCVDYFNKHDTDDEPITANDIYIMSYTDIIGIGWSVTVYIPNGHIYNLNTIDAYNTVEFTKYEKCGVSLYKWEQEGEG